MLANTVPLKAEREKTTCGTRYRASVKANQVTLHYPNKDCLGDCMIDWHINTGDMHYNGTF